MVSAVHDTSMDSTLLYILIHFCKGVAIVAGLINIKETALITFFIYFLVSYKSAAKVGRLSFMEITWT